MRENKSHSADSEILCEIDELTPAEWVQVLEALEPFGHGNPVPRALARNAFCTSFPKPLPLKENAQAWGVKASFLTIRNKIITPVWRDCDAALRQLRIGRRYNLELEVTAKPHNSRLFYNWTVFESSHAQPAHPTPPALSPHVAGCSRAVLKAEGNPG